LCENAARTCFRVVQAFTLTNDRITTRKVIRDEVRDRLFVFFRELETHHGNETCQKWEKIVNKLLLGAVTAAFARISERNSEEKKKVDHLTGRAR
jgi:hypothetical protein